MHGIWWFEWLGPWRDGEWDSDQIDNDWYDDGVYADPIAGTLTFTPTVADPNPAWYTRYYSPGGKINVHGWIDWDRDGDWNMTDEFIVNWTGYPGDAAGWPNTASSISVTQPFSVPDSVFGADDVVDLWMRFRLDYATNFENPIDFTRFGEVEDQVLTVVRPTRPDWADKVVPIDVSPVITFAKVVTGVAVSIQPSVLITPVWSVRGSPLSKKSTLAATYGNQLTLEHARLTPDTVYTVTLSSGYTHPEGDPVLPSSFSFTSTCTDVAGVELLLLTAGTLYTDTNVRFRVDVAPDNATKPYTYTIDYDDGTPVSQVTSHDDPLLLDHTFATTGVHEVVLSTWNCGMNAGDAFTDVVEVTVSELGVCVPLTYVDYNRLPYYPQAREVVSFVIAVYAIQPFNATLPYTYTWNFDDGSTGKGALVTHTFAVSKTYAVAVTATNPCDINVYMTHYIPITGEAEISVMPSLLDTSLDPGLTSTLLLTVSNASTATANLEWRVQEDPAVSWLDVSPGEGMTAPGEESAVGATFDASGMDPGVYATTLEIAHNAPNASAVRVPVTLTVNCVPVTDVDLAMTNTGLIYTDTQVAFVADIVPDAASTAYTYTVDFDDGISAGPQSGSGDPLTFSHTFTQTGTYTVTVAVWNCDMAQPVTALLRVQVVPYGTCVPVESVVLSTVSSTLYMGEQLALSADIVPDNADKSYTYTIDYDDSTPIVPTTSSDDPLLLMNSYVETGTYTIQINVWNCAMTVPMTDTVEVEVFQPAQPPENKLYLPLILRSSS